MSAVLLAFLFFTQAPHAPTSLRVLSSDTERLLGVNDFVYLGAFRVPSGTGHSPNGYGFEYGSRGIGFNPGTHGLLLVGHTWFNLTAELAIPTPQIGPVSGLPVATYLQDFADVTEGHLRDVLENGATSPDSVLLDGLLVYRGKLIGDALPYYDANNQARRSFFTHDLLLTKPSFSGMHQVGPADHQGFIAGYMALIPSQWQSRLGGPILAGQSGLPIIYRQSFGPDAWILDPDHLGTVSPVPSSPVLNYPADHPTLGNWSETAPPGNDYNMGTTVTGAVFPAGSRSVLFLGRQGLGTSCYGSGYGLSGPGEMTIEQNAEIAYGPCNLTTNNHSNGSPPYKYWVWAYDAGDLEAVKNGSKQPWDVLPYAVWPLELNGTVDVRGFAGDGGIHGTAYDPDTQTMYVAEMAGDVGAVPLIHVFHINVTRPTTGDTTPPSTPTMVTAVSPSSHEVRVTWQSATDNVGVTRYHITRNGKGLSTEQSTATSYTDVNLWASSTYAYAVQAMDAAGNLSGLSASVSATTHSVAGAPKNLRAAWTNGHVVLSWDVAVDDHGTPSAYYRLFRDHVWPNAIAVTSFGAFTDLTAAPGVVHDYTVQSLDSGLKLGGSADISVTP